MKTTTRVLTDNIKFMDRVRFLEEFGKNLTEIVPMIRHRSWARLSVRLTTSSLLISALSWNAPALSADSERILQAALQPRPAASSPQDTVSSRLTPERTELVFSAPPRGSLQEETATYQPLVDFLSQVIGKKVIYQHSDNWLSYSKNMTEGRFDIVFDGPAFNGWRMDRLKHTPLVKLPEDFVFVVVTRADNSKLQSVKQLAGQKICAHAPPNLGTLTLLSQFDNPVRQPLIISTKGWDNNYKALIDGKCAATILPVKNLQKMDSARKLTRTLYTHKALPNQALSVGPHVPTDLHDKITQALLSGDGRAATEKLRAAYAGSNFVPAQRNEYATLGILLNSSLYYE